MKRTIERLEWIVPVAILGIFVWNSVSAIVHHDAGGALLMGIAIGLLIASLMLRVSRWRS